MANFDEIANWAVPAILIIIVLGFIWTKFGEPYVAPMLKKFWEWLKAQNNPEEQQYGKREIVYGD